MSAVPSDEEFLAYNQGVISEFRANHGVVTQPPFPVLLLTTTGARTGRPATVPLGFAVDDQGRVFVMASKAGALRHPSWFHNLQANSSVTVEIGEQSFKARAMVTAGEERDRLYGMISDGAAEYEKNTDRVFPVVVLEGVPAPAYEDPLRKGLPAVRAQQAVGQVLGGSHLSVLATSNSDGSSQMSVIFVKPDDDDILFSTIEGRRKTANIRRDPRVTLLLHSLTASATDSAYATVYGTAEITDDPGGAFHQAMYGSYMGGATPPPEPGAHRLIVRIRPERIYAALPYSSE
jgi:PPOX class probable F420-dependent enzyme/deazaflavin-dependent oxidoreductase (nitroreductase family)